MLKFHKPAPSLKVKFLIKEYNAQRNSYNRMHRSAQGRQVALALYDVAQFPQDAGKSREDEVQPFPQAQDASQGNQEIITAACEKFPARVLRAFFFARKALRYFERIFTNLAFCSPPFSQSGYITQPISVEWNRRETTTNYLLNSLSSLPPISGSAFLAFGINSNG